MIIRKPYAFLIKNFRLIHFIMLVISGFVLLKSLSIYDFFKDYAAHRQFIESETLVSDTIPIWIMLFSIILIVAASSIIVLFNKKDKPKLFYITNVIYYVIFIIICIISRGIITTIIYDGLDPRISRIVRDIWLIAFILQIIVVGFYLIRTLGFDVKKFNFGEDVNELKIDAEDNEEYEINTRFDADKVKMKAAMQKEELKAFFYENKLMIVAILVLLLVVIPGTFLARNIIANRRYTVGQEIDLDNFTFKITDSYITKKDYKGENLFVGDNSYLIIKFNIENESTAERGINLNNLRLEINEKVYMPTTTYYQYFTDLGTGYNNQKISKGNKEYIVVYVVNDDELKNDIVVRYADKMSVKNSEITALYYRFNIKPKKLDENIQTVTNTLNQEMLVNLEKKLETKIKILHYNIKDKFTYESQNKTKYIINSTGLTLSLNYTFSSDTKDSLTSFSELLEKYGTIKYVVDDLAYSQKIVNITPKAYSSNDIFLAVSENIKDASSIELVFKVRNIEYVYKIK